MDTLADDNGRRTRSESRSTKAARCRAVAGFVPDCAVLFTRLLRDARVPRRRKLLLAAVAVYLSIPFDLVPDFIPVAGQLDDAVIVVLALRSILRASGRELVAQHWPGPRQSLDALLRLVTAEARPGSARGA